MGDLFDTFTVTSLVAGGVDIMTSQLGLIVIGVGIAPVIARKGFRLLRGAAR